MKIKHLFQVVVMLAVLFSALGMGQQAQAQSGVQIVMRDLTYWNATYNGSVDATRYEKWPLNFAEPHDFVVTVTPTSGDLIPLILLLDVNGVELARGVGSLTSTQPIGSYFVQVQPNSGGGTYGMTLREVQVLPTVTTVLDADSIEIGQTSLAIVSLSNVPAEGYASVEFTCTYDPALVSAASITAGTDLFGADAAFAVSGPTNGSFIMAIAGSNGNRVLADGAAFTFVLTGLAIGQTAVDCTARVSSGAGDLTSIEHVGDTLAVSEVVVLDGTLNGVVIASKQPTISLYNADSTLLKSVLAGEGGAFTTNAPAGTYAVLATAEGFLSALGSATLTSGNTTTMPTITLIAGDIDNNDVIDEWDAMTIGMSYNTPTPSAADLNNDAIINVLDLELLAQNFRQVGPIAWE